MTRPASLPVTPFMITNADATIAAHIRRTPLLRPQRGSFGLGHDLMLKLELLQHAGSFKPRGAFYNLLERKAPKAGVAAASGGNHGAAVAYAAKRLGLPARIFVPEISSPAKIAAIRHFGAEVVVGGARYNDALAACEAYVAHSGALSVHAYDALETVTGQGTLAHEWHEQLAAMGDGIDTVLVATGGGGLVSGIAAYWHGKVKVVAVEPEGSCALHAALQAGGPVDVAVESVAADSLGARNVGALVHQICAATVDHVALVPDASIVEAQKLLWRDIRIAAEPGGATALAALLSGAYAPARDERVGVLVCGGNVDLNKLAALA
ncbi:MAG: threonine/serine dehydratase [Beijerinckiaceae bacterium]